MFLVGLTGGIGSGKSTVAAMFRELNCPIVDADLIAREVVEPGKPAWRQIRQTFGSEVFNEDGTLNRDKLAEIVFKDPARRHELNSITHPEIYKSIVFQLIKLFIRGHQFVILDLPLLFESGKMVPYMNTILVVYCSRPTQIERLRVHRGHSTETALQRIDAQMSLSKKRSLATHIINNEGTLDELRERVGEVHGELVNSRAQWKLRGVAMLVLGVISTTVAVLVKYVIR